MNELWDIRIGDCRNVLEKMPEQSVQCVVTSPPYWGQRDYGVEGMIGLESDVQAWVAELVEVFRKVRRVLRDDGTVWLNLGDKYNNKPKGSLNGQDKSGLTSTRTQEQSPPNIGGLVPELKKKDLIGLPWRVAFALQDDGWYLRRDIIWSKPNPMPESVTDRPTSSHEYMFLLTKSAKYFYDGDAVRTPLQPKTYTTYGSTRTPLGNDALGKVKADNFGRTMPVRKPRNTDKQRGHARPHTGFNDRWDGMTHEEQQAGGANLRSVWNIATHPFSEAHFATFPEKLVEPCIKAGTSERGECPECGAPWERVVEKGYGPDTSSTNHIAGGDRTIGQGWEGTQRRATVNVTTTGWQPSCDHDAEPDPQIVLDPFSGAGTTGLVAARFGRRYMGIELNPEYAEMSRRRIATGVGARSPETAEVINAPIQGLMALNTST